MDEDKEKRVLKFYKATLLGLPEETFSREKWVKKFI